MNTDFFFRVFCVFRGKNRFYEVYYVIYLKTTSMKVNWKQIALYILRIIELIITGAAGGAITQL